MKRIICILMAVITIIGMTACGKSKVDIEKLKQIKGTMLTITSSSQGEMTQEEYEKSKYEISVSYEGAAYIPNPVNSTGIMITDKDYLKIYNFCTNSVKTHKFNNYKEDVCDGTSYSFTFYDENGEAHKIYSGYIYNNKELSDIIDTITAYSVD